jgi:hypothetical protein
LPIEYDCAPPDKAEYAARQAASSVIAAAKYSASRSLRVATDQHLYLIITQALMDSQQKKAVKAASLTAMRKEYKMPSTTYYPASALKGQ